MELLDLSGRRARKIVNNNNFFGVLLTSEPLAIQKGGNLGNIGGLGIFDKPHNSATGFTKARVRNAHDGSFKNGRMALQGVFDLLGREVLSSSNDQIFFSP